VLSTLDIFFTHWPFVCQCFFLQEDKLGEVVYLDTGFTNNTYKITYDRIQFFIALKTSVNPLEDAILNAIPSWKLSFMLTPVYISPQYKLYPWVDTIDIGPNTNIKILHKLLHCSKQWQSYLQPVVSPQGIHHLATRFSIENWLQSLYNKLPVDIQAMWLPYTFVLNTTLSRIHKFPVQNAVIHGDLTLWNTLVTSKQLYIVDWETATQYDPLWDVASFTTEHGINIQDLYDILPTYCNRPWPTIFRLHECFSVILHFYWGIWGMWQGTLTQGSKQAKIQAWSKQRFDTFIQLSTEIS
jgi:Phosphotransferase enzyme family